MSGPHTRVEGGAVSCVYCNHTLTMNYIDRPDDGSHSCAGLERVLTREGMTAAFGETEANRADTWAQLMRVESKSRHPIDRWLDAADMMLAAGATMDQVEAVDRAVWVTLLGRDPVYKAPEVMSVLNVMGVPVDAGQRLANADRWKTEAMQVLGQWDDVAAALGHPGALGDSIPLACLREVLLLRARLLELEAKEQGR